MEYLGFIINSENIITSLSDVKKQKIRSLYTNILNDDFPVIWKVASLLRKIYSTFSAGQFGRLYYRALERDKILTLTFRKGNFDKKMIRSSPGNDSIYWWFDNISTTFNEILMSSSEVALIIDPSKLGWVLL